jgi:hypothetical protein
MVATGGKFTVKPEGTDVRRILIAHAVRYKSGIRNGHEILEGFAARPPTSERVFANGSSGFKSNVLKDNRVTHKGPPFAKLSRKLALAPLKSIKRGSKEQQTRHLQCIKRINSITCYKDVAELVVVRDRRPDPIRTEESI